MVKRFDVKTCMMQENEGKYVLYSEYAALKAELAQQTTNSQSVAALDVLIEFLLSRGIVLAPGGVAELKQRLNAGMPALHT